MDASSPGVWHHVQQQQRFGEAGHVSRNMGLEVSLS